MDPVTIADYTEADLLAALFAAGIASGDLLFVHADLDALGTVEACASADERAALLAAVRRW